MHKDPRAHARGSFLLWPTASAVGARLPSRQRSFSGPVPSTADFTHTHTHPPPRTPPPHLLPPPDETRSAPAASPRAAAQSRAPSPAPPPPPTPPPRTPPAPR